MSEVLEVLIDYNIAHSRNGFLVCLWYFLKSEWCLEAL